GERKLSLGFQRGNRRAESDHSARRKRREGRLLARPIREGWKGSFRDHRSRFGISATGLHRPGQWEAYLSRFGREVRCGRVGPELRRQIDRLYLERKRPEHDSRYRRLD